MVYRFNTEYVFEGDMAWENLTADDIHCLYPDYKFVFIHIECWYKYPKLF